MTAATAPHPWWRVFALDDSGLLVPPFWPAPLDQDGTRLFAACHLGHEPPADGCGCGVYAARRLARLNGPSLDKTVPATRRVYARVTLLPPLAADPARYGDARGYARAAGVELVKLHVHAHAPRHAVAALAATYPVPIHAYRGTTP